MSIVELMLLNEDAVYVNPRRVRRLQKSGDGLGDQATEIVFGPDDRIVVKGDLDTIAFQLFPAGIR
jgi:hypothetical protein